MKEIVTTCTISATPKKVWDVLINFEKYPQWIPFIKYISGNKKVGEKLKVSIKLPDVKTMNFKPLIVTLDQYKEFRWVGKLVCKGLFDGEHYFILSENSNSTTNFIHGEIFSGLLVGVFRKILNKTKQGFELMNKAIKAESEK